MIAGKKYEGLMVDIWSCGVILYAMLCGFLPFEDKDTAILYQKIQKGEFIMPVFLSDNSKDMIKSILNTDPTKRFKIDKIRSHPWYNIIPSSEYDEGIIIGTNSVSVNIIYVFL